MYITGYGNISPQLTHDGASFLQKPVSFPGNRLFCQEPDYKPFIGPVQIRRMGRIVKMGITSAKLALAEAGIENPDAIIVGTGLGCLEDTQKFLRIMLDDAEQTAAPTPFISSTHNSVAGAIALQLKCLGYNYTYVHRGFSFMSCLLDAKLQMELYGASHVLVGGIDEMTDSKYKHNSLIRKWNTRTPDTLSAPDFPSEGTLSGEGSTFFILSASKPEKKAVRIGGFSQCYSDSPTETALSFSNFLKENNLTKEPFLLLTGRSGDLLQDAFYNEVENMTGSMAGKASFKHLCGAYYTSDAFGLWTAAHILIHQKVPDILRYQGPENLPQHVVVYDQPSSGEHVFQWVTV
jgi:3-oxoacyl-[acyl-carrier-protein] synthase II